MFFFDFGFRISDFELRINSYSTTSSAAASAATAPGTSMTYRQMEEAINKWTVELEEQEKVFLNQATQVNAWDRMLFENGDKIVSLNDEVEKVKVEQTVIVQKQQKITYFYRMANTHLFFCVVLRLVL